MPKFGRRKWVRRKRAEQRRHAHVARLTQQIRPDLVIALEVGLDSFWRYRTSPEWQELGWWGRWLNTWHRIGREARWRGSPLSALSEMHKQVYADLGERLAQDLYRSGDEDDFTMRIRSYGNLIVHRPGGFFPVE